MEKDKLGFFRFNKLDDKMLLTNEVGDFLFVSNEDFAKIKDNNIKELDSGLQKELADKDFLHDGTVSERLITEYRKKNSFLKNGPILHIIILTLNCNHGCHYCHASSQPIGKPGYMMSKETADKIIDVVFSSPSPFVTLEFTGGEPLANFEVLKHMIERAESKEKETGKTAMKTLVSNLTLMDDEKLKYLLDHNIAICTSLDGPEELHNKYRIWAKGNSYQTVTGWIQKINNELERRAQADGRDDFFRVGALITVSKDTLKYPKEVIDTYIENGSNEIFIRPIHHFGYAQRAKKVVSYEIEEFLDFYFKALDYIIEKNIEGVELMETFAVTFLTKILLHLEPNMLDVRSPTGSGNGQLAYTYDGLVYTCDEGRMLGHSGDDAFLLGNVHEDSYRDIMSTEVVKAVVPASITDLLACDTCVFKPYCGVSPLHSYAEHGSIYSQLPNVRFHKHRLAILEYLFRKLQDPKVRKVFENWVMQKQNIPVVE